MTIQDGGWVKCEESDFYLNMKTSANVRQFQAVHGGVTIFGPAIAFQGILGVPAWISLLVTTAISTIYTAMVSIQPTGHHSHLHHIHCHGEYTV